MGHENDEEYRVDRSKWPEGPWDREPSDKVNWVDPATDLDCMMLRNSFGAWCGYVGVPPNHPHHEVEYHSLDGYWEVHGGLTYSEKCVGHICHIPEPGRPDDVWWIGFDTSHSCDLAPGDLWFPERHRDFSKYRTQQYVKLETEKLAKMVQSFSV